MITFHHLAAIQPSKLRLQHVSGPIRRTTLTSMKRDTRNKSNASVFCKVEGEQLSQLLTHLSALQHNANTASSAVLTPKTNRIKKLVQSLLNLKLIRTLEIKLGTGQVLKGKRTNLEQEEMGSGAGTFIKVLLKNFDVLAGPVVSLVYPLYASVRAIETKSQVDDRQWLTYWVLYSMITLFELTFAKVIEWIPIWSYAKLLVTCWLVIPYFSGAAYVYEHFVRPLFINPQQTINIWYVPRKKDVFSQKDDIITAAEKYIAENGTEAFEQLIHRADKSRSHSYGNSIFEDDYRY